MALLMSAIAVGVGAAAQGMSGVGFALVAGPMLVAALGRYEGVRIVLLLSLLVNAVMLVVEHRSIMWRRIGPTLAVGLPATVLLVYLARGVHPRLLNAAAGIVILLGVAMIAIGRFPEPGWPGAVIAGLASAAMSVLSAASGPPMALYAASARWRPDRTRATLQAYFLPLNALTLAALGPPRSSLPQTAALVAALVVGSAAGILGARYVAARPARIMTLTLAGAGGAALLLTAIAG